MKTPEKAGISEQKLIYYEFGGFVLDPSRRLLLREGRSIHLTGRCLDTLLELVEHRGEAMDKDDLLRLVWPHTVVEENNLNQCISVLRKALGEAPGENRFIVTLPGRGYRFVAPVIERPLAGEGWPSGLITAAPAAPATRTLPAVPAKLPGEAAEAKTRKPAAYRRAWWIGLTTAGIIVAGIAAYIIHHQRNQSDAGRALPEARRAVAVMGFQNLSQRPSQAWLSTAFSEMLMTELGSGGKLRIIPGEAVTRAQRELALKETGSLSRESLERVRKDLDPDLVVSGAYTVSEGEGRRIRLDLIVQNAVTGETITSLSETGPEQDMFDLVSRSGSRLRQALGVEDVSRTETEQARAAMPPNSEAARLYAEGLAKRRGFDYLGARDTLERAVAAAPDFPLSHGALADALDDLGYQAKASSEAKRAFELSSQLSREEQLLIEGRYYGSLANWPKEIEVYRSLYDFFPDNVEYGLRLVGALGSAGKFQDALLTLHELRKLPEACAALAEELLAQGHAPEAKLEIERAVALVSHSQAQVTRLRVKVAAARVEAALGHYAEPGVQKPLRDLTAAISQARSRGEAPLALEARLGQAEIEMHSGHTTAARSHIDAIEKDAKGNGFRSLERQAALARAIHLAAKT